MLRRAPSCHEGETADRAAAVMRQLDVEVVPVLNDNDSATGLALGEELDRALRRPGGHRLRLREVMRRLGFVVCRWSEGRSVAENLAGKAQKKLDDVKRVLGS